MGFEKFLEKAVDIFTGFSCERFQEISADFPQNNYLGGGPTQNWADRFPSFDFYLIERTDGQTDKQSMFID